MSAYEEMTDKQRKFLHCLFENGFNGTKAAREAQYSYPTKAASKLLKKPHIRRAIEERFETAHIGPQEIVGRLGQQARNEGTAYILSNGTVDLEAMIAEGKTHLIKSVKRTKHGPVVTFHDPQKAIELIGKHSRLFDDYLNVEVTWQSEAEEMGIDPDELVKQLTADAVSLIEKATVS